MNRKIMGVTVGTPISPQKIKEEIKPVQTVNGQAPDENGNVDIEVGGGGGGGIERETDPTVPAWAKQPNKPTYTAAEVGAIPAYTYGTTDLVDGVSALEPGTLYFVY